MSNDPFAADRAAAYWTGFAAGVACVLLPAVVALLLG
jgi:hypothetical protein